MSVVFDGVDDVLQFGTLSTPLLNIATGAYTVAALIKRTSGGASSDWDPIYGYKLTGTPATFDLRASTEFQSSTILSMQDEGNNRNWTHGIGSHANVNLLVIVSKAAGAVAFNASILRLDTMTWFHGVSTTTGSNRAAMTSTAVLQFGQAGSDFLGGRLGVCATWVGTAFDQTQRMEVGTNLQTSDMANHSAGAPDSIIEFTSLTPTDLMGGVGAVVLSSAPTLDNTDTMGWTYDGLGATGGGTFNEAGVTFNDSDSTFNNFVGAAAPTPQVGSDSFTLSEAAVLAQTRQISVSDSAALAEAPTLERQSSRTDTFTLTEALALGVSISLADNVTLSEASGLTVIENKLGSDAFALSEAAAVSTIDLKLGSDTFNLSEARALAIASAVSDTAALTEAAAIAANLSAADAAALTEAVLLTTQDSKSGSDTFAMAEALALQAGLSVADAAAVAEQSQVAAALTAVDAGALSEARALSAALAVSDTAALAEAISLLSFDAKLGSDSFTLSEARALTAQLSVSDAAALAEAVSLAASVAATDLATLTEAFIGGQQLTKTGSDSFALSEAASAVRTNQLSVADSAALSEALALTAQIARTDNLSLSESVSLIQLVLKSGIDSGTLSESASLVIQVGAPYLHSLPPQFARGSHRAEAIIRAASARTGTAGHAALVIGANSARLFVFSAQTGLVVVDAEADAEGRYEGDATLT